MQVQRGSQSWDYIHVFLGFALAIEGEIIQMFELGLPWNLLIYVTLGVLTWYLFRHDPWFQNKLTGWRGRHEAKWR